MSRFLSSARSPKSAARFIPDFLVRLDVCTEEPMNLVLETKGCRGLDAQSRMPLPVLPAHYAIIHARARASQIAVKIRLVAKPLLTTTDAKSFGHDCRFAVEKARHALGWAPRTSVKDGLAAALDALMSNARIQE